MRLWVILLVLSISGCQKYKDQIASQADEIAQLRVDKADLLSERDHLESYKAGCEKEIADFEASHEELSARIASLVEYQKALEAQIEKLGGDKSKMAAQYKAAKENLAAQQRMIDEMKRKQAQARKRLEMLKKMLSQFKSLIAGGKLNVRIRNGKLTLELPSAILFQSGRAHLSAEGKETLAEVAKVLATIKGREFQVAGHTDNVPISTKAFPSNWELSTARGVAVVKFLQEQGVRPKWLSAAGYSEYQPTNGNDSSQQRALNRRIEIVLMPNLDELPDVTALEKELKK